MPISYDQYAVLDEKVKVKRPVRTRKVAKQSKQQSLDKIIATLQSLGYKITPASSEEDKVKQEESLTKLGMKSSKKLKPQKLTKLVCTLQCRHLLSGQVFGPGLVELEPHQEALLQALLHQDQLAKAEFYGVHSPTVQTFLVGRGSRKIPVSDYQLQNLEAFEPAVSAGKYDAAGYNPNFNPTGQF